MSGLLCHVTWNNHSSTFLSFLRSLHLKDSLCDATVACLGKYYPVHQLVLSSCSEYFEEIFSQIKCKHPFIIIKGVKPIEFEALLNYMYKGEVNVPEDKLSDLIKAAEELRVKGLSAPDHSPDEAPTPPKQMKRAAPSFGPSPLVKRRKDNWLPNTSQMKSLQGNMEGTIHSRPLFTQNVIGLEEEFHHLNQVQSTTGMSNEEDEVSFSPNLSKDISSNSGCESLQSPLNTKGLQNDIVPVVEEVILTASDHSTAVSDTKNGDEFASKMYKVVDNLPISSTSEKVNNVTSSVQTQCISQLPPFSVSDVATDVRPSSEESSTKTLSSKVPKETDKTRSKQKSFKKLSSPCSSSSSDKKKGSRPSRAIITKRNIDRGVHIAGKSFPSINPMVKLNVDEYLRAVEEMERVKARSKGGNTTPGDSLIESTRSDSVVHVSDSEISSEMSGSFCSEKIGEKGKEDDTLSLELQFSTVRRSSHLSSQSDHEDVRSEGEIPASQNVSERKVPAKNKCKLLQSYNLNHIPLNNIFTYRVFRNLNLFIECLMKDKKKEDAFGRSLISVFKSYMNYTLISDTIAQTLVDHHRDSQGRWIQKLAGLDPPVFGRHVHLDAQTGEVLFSNDVIPALMVIWQFRVLINKHGLVKDLKPGFTSTPRHKFLLGIKQGSSFFQKEQLCIFKNNLRNFYRYSLKGNI